MCKETLSHLCLPRSVTQGGRLIKERQAQDKQFTLDVAPCLVCHRLWWLIIYVCLGPSNNFVMYLSNACRRVVLFAFGVLAVF